MIRTSIVWPLALLLGACTAGSPKPPITAPLVLTGAQPAARTTVRVPARPAYLAVDKASMENPARVAATVVVSIEIDGVEHEVGRVNPYPDNTLGPFRLAIPPDGVAALRGRRRAMVTVRLTAGAGVRVTLDVPAIVAGA